MGRTGDVWPDLWQPPQQRSQWQELARLSLQADKIILQAVQLPAHITQVIQHGQICSGRRSESFKHQVLHGSQACPGRIDAGVNPTDLEPGPQGQEEHPGSD